MERGEYEIIEASLGKRFANYIIDHFCIAIFISMIFDFLEAQGYRLVEDIYSLRVRLIAVLLYALIYFVIESLTGGKSFGKWVTKTRAVEFDGGVPDTETFIIRSFSRIIPFEPLSFLFLSRGWHDRFSKTMVMDEKLTIYHTKNDEEE
jgi:uncharacterized RDD family membrane protein YckC